MRWIYLAGATASLFVVAPCMAQSDPGPAAKPAKEKKVCHSEKVTGSLTKVRKICMTEAEWDALRRDTKHDLEDMQRNLGAVPGREVMPSAGGPS